MSTNFMDVTMPDGTIVRDVPAGTTQAEVLRRYNLKQSPAGTTEYKQETARRAFEANKPVPTAGTGLANLRESLWNNMKGIPTALADTAQRLSSVNPADQASAVKDILTAPLSGAMPVWEYIQALNARDPDRAATAAGSIMTQTLPAVYGGAKLLKTGADLIPNAKRAGANIQIVETAARGIPIDTSALPEIVNRARQLAKAGNRMPSVMSKTANAVQNPAATTLQGEPYIPFAQDPMAEPVVPSARDLGSSAGKLSAMEKAVTKGPMKAQVAKLAKALSDANRDVAAQVGMGDIYDQAITEYRQAMKMSNLWEGMRSIAKRRGVQAVGAGLGLGVAEEIARKYLLH